MNLLLRWGGLSLLPLLLIPIMGFAQIPPDSPEVLRPGDAIRIQVWRQPELSGEFPVLSSGAIGHPLYRDLRVADRPIGEVEEDIRRFLTEYETRPRVVIEARFRVALAGEVRQPTVHAFRPGTAIAEALATTGGVSDRGRLDQVLLRRGGREYLLDLTNPATPARKVTVRSGDEIIVQRKRQIFRNYIAPGASVVGAVATLLRIFRVF